MSRIKIDQIETDGTQSRSTMDPATIDEYASAMQAGSQFPPVIVFSEGNGYWLADGFHRLAATIATGEDSIEADVRQGGKREAILYSVGANSAHGLRRTNEDKRRSVLRLLEDAEWGKWSNREIARRCNVAEGLVRKVREEAGLDTAHSTQYLHPKTGAVTTMQTGNIGKSHGRCAKCNRPLTDPGSIAAGVGPCCATHNHASNGQGADAESDTESQFITAAWDIPTEQTVDDLPVYGMSDDDVDVVYARGNRKSMADANIDKTPQKFNTQPYVAAVDKVIRDQPDATETILADLRDGRRGWYHDLILCYTDDATPELWQEVAQIIDARRPSPFEKTAETDEDDAHSPDPVATRTSVPISATPDYDGDEWYTPAEYIEAARMVMGRIDLDPASCLEAQKTVNAQQFYTKKDDALSLTWTVGNVWLNPPYSAPLIQAFVDKVLLEFKAGNVQQAVILVNNNSDTKWFHSLLSRFPACFTRGRIQFWRPNWEQVGTRQGQTFFYIGPNVEKFRDVFSAFGIVVQA